MATIKQSFGTSTAITITKASMASSATVGRESAVIDNSSNLYVDALLYVALQVAAGTTPTANTFAYIYGYASEDGTNYTDNATGSDADITLRSPTNLRLIGQLAWAAVSNCQVKGVFSVAQAFGGVLPRKWGIVIVQSSGQALHATAGTAIAASYTGVCYTSA